MKGAKPGITLIELIVGLLLSSVLISALFAMYGTITRTVSRATETMDRDRAVVVFQHQWQRDIEGVFAPPYPKKESKKTEDASAVGNKQEKKETEPEKKKEQPKPIKKVFDATIKDGSMNVVTFITTNPVAVYEKSQVGSKPRMVRVVYRLQSDGKKPATYRLMRQESEKLDFDSFNIKEKSVKDYELLGSIKKFTIEYLLAKEEKKETQEKEKKKKGKTFKSFNEWHSDERHKEDKPLIPQIIKTKLVLTDEDRNKEMSYEFNFQIPAYNQAIPEEQKAENKVPSLPATNKQQPKQQPTSNSQQQGRGMFSSQSPRLSSLLDQIEKKIDAKLGMN